VSAAAGGAAVSESEAEHAQSASAIDVSEAWRNMGDSGADGGHEKTAR
jgi:hypothetical protein